MIFKVVSGGILRETMTKPKQTDEPAGKMRKGALTVAQINADELTFVSSRSKFVCLFFNNSYF